MNKIKLKICGVQSTDEARQLADLGVDYIGLNFISTSKRCISIHAAESIASAVRGNTVQVVALFQNQPLEMVNNYAHRIGANYVQLHGDESADYAQKIALPVIRAIGVDSSSTTDEIINYIANFPAEYFVLDRKEQGKGNAVRLDPVKEVIAVYPSKIFLAGGLKPDNLTSVLTQVQPFAIDISAGVRTDGDTDMAKVVHCQQIIHEAI